MANLDPLPVQFETLEYDYGNIARDVKTSSLAKNSIEAFKAGCRDGIESSTLWIVLWIHV